VFNNDVVFRIDCRLDVVADHPGPARLHGAGIRVGQGNLPIWRILELNLDCLECLHLFLEGGNLVLQAHCSQLRYFGFLTIGGVEGREILIDACFNLLHPPLHFIFGEVPVTVVDCLELATVNGDECVGEQVKLLA